MDTESNTKTKANTKKDKGYHIRNLDPNARRQAKVAAVISGVNIGTWISRAIIEKFHRDSHRKEVITEKP